MNSLEITLRPRDLKRESDIEVLRIHVSQGQSIVPDEPIMDVRTTEEDDITLVSPMSGSVLRCPADVGDTIAPDEPLLFLSSTDPETVEANQQTTPTGSVEEPFVAVDRVPFTVLIGDPFEARYGVLGSHIRGVGGTSARESGVEVRTFYLPVDQAGRPRKVGDGSYSVVFEAEDNDYNRFALKVLYDRESQEADKLSGGSAALTLQVQKADFGITLERFETECQSMRVIRSVIAGREGLPSGTKIHSIVYHVGRAENLRQELAGVFEAIELKLSHVGLVTELYQGTLKECLEKPRKDHEGHEETGYGILRELGFVQRIRTILPFINDVANGLSIMYEAGYSHLDLKPANIFWRRTDREGFQAAIGDLGYIKSVDDSIAVTSDRYAALGTLHYRSPEQKDFKDFCEVDILESDNPEEIWLTTNDPKFRGTIVEKGDNLIFLSDLSRSFRIEDIRRYGDEGSHIGDGVTTILMKSLDHQLIKPDRRTQAVVYKNQGIRTDLFGFGAIVYDLLTCGNSPERFYNNLIVDDVASESVTSITDNYERIETRSRRDPKYSHIFESFYDGRERRYAPIEVVNLILKCMLYRTKGTYYDANKRNPFDDVLVDVGKLKDKYGMLDSIKKNSIVSETWERRGETTPTSPNNLRDEVSKQQGLSADSPVDANLIVRTAWAALRLTQLIRLIKQTLRLSTVDPKKDDGRVYFVELAPENISVLDQNLDFRGRGYSRREDFVAELLEDAVHTRTILYDSQNPFSSFEYTGDIRRRVRLVPIGDPPTWRYHFLDSSRIGESVSEGDWIVVPGKCVACIQVLDDGRLKLIPVREIEGDEYLGFHEELATRETFFLRNLDPLGYCLAMLGTYVYQLFFVGLNENFISEPQSVQSLKAQLRASPSRADSVYALLREALYQPAYQEGASKLQNWNAVYHRLTGLYLALSLPEVRSLFGHGNILDELGKVWEDSICRDLARTLDLRQESFFSDPENLRGDLGSKLGLSQEGDGTSDEEIQSSAENIMAAADLLQHVRNILLRSQPDAEIAATSRASRNMA